MKRKILMIRRITGVDERLNVIMNEKRKGG